MELRQILFISYLLPLAALAADESEAVLAPVEVRARTENLLGESLAGSEGVVSSQRLQTVPLLRPGEALEMVPGLIVTQHAGDGKANQYFLRGFNLDHGTDFATTVAGVPANMPSHAHGQGYTDLNFMIPELIERIRFRKGPYYADEGDFSSAGAAHIDYFRRLDAGLAQATLGDNGYARSLLADSPEVGGGRLLYAFEWFHNDGPWEVPEDYRKQNGVLSYSRGDRHDGWALTAMAYRGGWVSTDQVAARAVEQGLVGTYGSLDPTTGGRSERYSLAGEWAGRGDDRQSRASAWWLASSLDLWSNFQYCTNACPPGDQFRQSERRQAGGFTLAQSRYAAWGGFDVENSFGLQGRVDRLRPVGLYATRSRDTLATLREDAVTQKSLGLWGQSEIRWLPWLRSVAGLRADVYDLRVDSSLAANSGKAADHLLTPKLSLVLGPWRGNEWYADYGHGFHSNDARGTTIRVDPGDGSTPVGKVPPLVRSRGYEIGWRGEPLPGWRSTLALWHLDLASELLFVGDAGTTEAARPSRRRGIEWSNLYVAADWLALDADFAFSHARYRGSDPAGDRIPGAVTSTANLGLTVDRQGPWFGALRLRYFGPRPLVEDGSVRSASSAIANLRIGYRFDTRTRLAVDIYNLFDRRANDIEYWYESRLSGEAEAAFDRHVHPAEPRTLRVSLSYRF